MQLYLRKQLSIAFIIYLGPMMVGFGLGWTAPMIPKLQDPLQTPLPDVVSAGQSSLIGSVLYIGTITGPYVSSYLSNVRGRKPCLFLGGTLTIIAFVLLAFARNLAMIFAGRIFTGLGTGIIFVITFVYIGEIASTNIRGMLLTGTGIFSTTGTLIVYSIGPYVPYAVTNYVGIVITACYVLGLLFIPETPAFYIIKGNQDEAKQVLMNIGRGEDIDSLICVKQEKSEESNWKDLFRIKSNRKAFVITFVLCILQQLSGIIVLIFFATSIFSMAGSSVRAELATIVIGAVQIVSSCLAPVFVERNGRRALLLLSTAICCFSLATLGTYFLLDHLELALVEKIQWLPLTILIVFFLSYDVGFGIIPSALIGELFQSNVRSIGSSIVITTGWLFGFSVSTSFSFMIDLIGGYGTFWLFSGSCAMAFLFTAFFVPETKGKTLLEIQEILSK